ncbi:MAG: rRNA maturation RNase YbeY [Candidatus Paceibacterota bacterium]
MPFHIRYLSRKTVNEAYIKHIVESSLRSMHKDDAEFDLVFIGKKRMRDLNRIYRGKDKVTDVLSFGNTYGSKKDPFVSPRDIPENLGEIFICTERAKEQAKQKGHSLKKELSILLIHGILHLAGFDHEDDKDARIMQRTENRLLSEL